MENVEIARLFEFGMLFCFGFSWPFAIAKTWKAKRVDGKSPFFAVLVMLGYVCGITAHLISDRSWVTWVYAVDLALVATDFTLYLFYSRRQVKEVQNVS